MKQLKIGNERTAAILVAGGPGFKIYAAYGVDGWLIVRGKKVSIAHENTPDYKIVSRYVNLRHQPASMKKRVRQDFDDFVKGGQK